MGFRINLNEKKLYLKQETATALKEDISKFLALQDPLGIPACSFEDLEAMLGKLNFCQKCCYLGRTRLHFLFKLLNEKRETQPSRITLDGLVVQELHFWLNFDLTGESGEGGFPLEQGNIDTCRIQTFSDASGGKRNMWGVRIPLKRDYSTKSNLNTLEESDDPRLSIESYYESGSFPPHLSGAPIECLEAYAMLKGFEKIEPDSKVYFFTDSQTLYFSMKKTMARNDQTNDIIAKILEIVHRKRILYKLFWIPTRSMAEYGADAISRGVFDATFNSLCLSKKGVEFVKELAGPPDLVLFSNTYQNHRQFKTRFSSFHYFEDDELCLKSNPFECLLGAELPDSVFIFPNQIHYKAIVDILASRKFRKDQQFLLIVPDFLVTSIAQTLNWNFAYRQVLFQRMTKQTNLDRKTRNTYYLLILTA